MKDMNNINKLIDFGIQAVTVYFSGVCNLECKYCFQPKYPSLMGSANQKIIDWIESGRMEDDIIDIFGDNITNLSLWGGEPTFNLPYLCDRLDSIYNKFPQLSEISFSTNMSKPIIRNNIMKFLLEIDKLNQKYCRRITVDLQFSIDGPPDMNDDARVGSSSIEIMDNITSFLIETSSLWGKSQNSQFIKLSLKGTHDADALKKLSNIDNLINFHKFFDDYRYKWKSICDFYPRGGGFLTFVCPGDCYDIESGYHLRDITKLLSSRKIHDYSWKIPEEMSFSTKLASNIYTSIDFLKRNIGPRSENNFYHSCNCSAGKSSLGLDPDRNIHWCHNTFFFNSDLLNKLKNDTGESNAFNDFYSYKIKTFDSFIKDISIVKSTDSLKLLRSLSMIENYNKNSTLRFQSSYIAIKELASCGQISECYKDDNWARLASSLLSCSGFVCPSENLWETGSVYTQCLNHYRLFLNGAFEEILLKIKQNEGNN